MIARRGSCKFGTVLSSGRKVLLAKSLPHWSGGKPSRILRNKGFSILDEFLSPSYDRLRVSPRDRTLKTKYYKDFRRGAFQLTINPMRDWNYAVGAYQFIPSTLSLALSINNKPYEGLKRHIENENQTQALNLSINNKPYEGLKHWFWAA